MKIENIILSELVFNQEYAEKVIYHIRDEFFTDLTHKELFRIIHDYYKKYYEVPGDLSVLSVEIETHDSANSQQLLDLSRKLAKSNYIQDWLIQKTEEWAKDRSLYIALSKSIDIADGNDESSTKSAIPEIMREALSFTFSTKCGHDYDEDYEERFHYYKDGTIKIPSNLYYLNSITNGGVEPKTLNLVMGGTGGFKSLFLCHLASSYYLDGKNVFYFTLELADTKVAQRIDANILNTPITYFSDISYSDYNKKLSKVLQSKNLGKLIIKEYPTVGASVANFKQFIHETGIKKGISPDVIIVDYLNICQSFRIRGSASGTYLVAKSIAEELRGMAVEMGVPIWTATQLTRSAQKSEEPELSDISESFGVANTCDLVLSIINNDNLNSMSRIAIKQLKNRYGDLYHNNRFELGIDKSKMMLYDVDNFANEEPDDKRILDFSDLKKENLLTLLK